MTTAPAADVHAPDAAPHREDRAYEALYFLFLSLVLGAAARGAVRGSRLPYTVALLFMGLAMGFLHAYLDLGVLGNSLDIWVDIGPHTMLSCFLPALVFESAFSLEWHTFRRCAAQVLWLAGPGVIFGTALMGALLKVTLPYGWGWASCLMLGAILSATDPVAVVALLKEVGASKRLGHIIEGESLVNDGTAIVVFSLLNEFAKGNDKTIGEVVLFFFWVPTGAVLVGLAVAAACHAWLGLGAVAGDHLVQISVTLFACYLCYLVAEFQAAASGVLAVVVLGVAIGAFGRGFFTGETEHSLHHFWEMLTFVANTVLFILTGVIIAETTAENTGEGTLVVADLGWGVLVYLEVIFARVVVMTLSFPILTRCGYGLTPADAAVCIWGGLRGAVGLALALVVSEESAAYSDEKVGPVVLLITGVVVVLTLAVNGTTTAALLQSLGLTRPEVSVQVAVRKARRHIREQCLAVYHEHLTTSDDVMGTADFRTVSDLVPFLTAVEDNDPSNHGNLHSNNGNAGNTGSDSGVSPAAAALAAAGGHGEPLEASSAGMHLTGAGEVVGTRGYGRSSGMLTPAPSIADLTAFCHEADLQAAAAAAAATAVAVVGSGSAESVGSGGGAGESPGVVPAVPVPRGLGVHKVKNALGEFDSVPNLAAAVAVAIKKDFEEMVVVWQRDVRGRLLAHLKVLYWEALEVGRATKEIVEMLVECTDTALDRLDAPLSDWRALETHMLDKARSGRPWWKRCFHAMPPRMRQGVRWVRQWMLHSGAHPGGGARRRALVAVALFHDAHQEAFHAIFGAHQHDHNQHDSHGGGGGGGYGHRSSSLPSEHSAAAANAALFDASLDMDDGGGGASRSMSDPAGTAAARVRGESEAEKSAARAYLRAARTNEPELAAAVKSEETARRLLAVAERSARGYVQSGLLTAVEAEELLSGITRAQRRLRLNPPEPLVRDPPDLMKMTPLLDPTHPARVTRALAQRLTSMAHTIVVRRFPGDAIAAAVPKGGLLLLARGVVEVMWARPFGDGGGGAVPLRVGATSSSYGWALGAADLLVPGAARFDMRAVSAVTAFIVPPDVVQDLLASPGTSEALWRAAFGLLAATLLRNDLAAVAPQVLRLASTRSRVTTHTVGETLGPFQMRRAPTKYPPRELVVLLRGELVCEGEGTLEAPCVVVPGAAHALTGDQAAKFGKLAARMGNSATGGSVASGLKRPKPEESLRGGGDGGNEGDKLAGGMQVTESAVVLRCPLSGGGAWGGEGEGVMKQGNGHLAHLALPHQPVSPDGLARRVSVNVASIVSRKGHRDGEGDGGEGVARHPHASAAGDGIGWGGWLSSDGWLGSGGGDAIAPSPVTHHSEGSELWPHSMDRTTRHLLSSDALQARQHIFGGGSVGGRLSLNVHSRAVAAEAAAMAGSLVAAGQGVHATMRAGSGPEGDRRASVGRDSFFASFGPPGSGGSGEAHRVPGTSLPTRLDLSAMARMNASDGRDTYPPRHLSADTIPEHSAVTPPRADSGAPRANTGQLRRPADAANNV